MIASRPRLVARRPPSSRGCAGCGRWRASIVPRRGSGTPQTSAEIGALERAGAAVVGELRRQAAMRAVVLGHDQQPARVLVEPVHDARPPHAADAGQAVAAMGDERVDQRAALMPGGRMHDEPGRLVDDDEVVVLVDDRERDRLAPPARPAPPAARRARCALPAHALSAGSRTTAPSTATRPSRISACRRLRDRSRQARARTRSSRSARCRDASRPPGRRVAPADRHGAGLTSGPASRARSTACRV